MMILRYVVVAFVGAASGIVVSSALFAVLVVLGAVNKTASILGRADKVRMLEWVICIGAIVFNMIYLFAGKLFGGYIILALLGMFFGVFIGIMLMALAEETRVLPILFMRLKMKQGIICVVIGTALGKVIGCLYDLIR
jgi:hypothetical protein